MTMLSMTAAAAALCFLLCIRSQSGAFVAAPSPKHGLAAPSSAAGVRAAPAADGSGVAFGAAFSVGVMAAAASAIRAGRGQVAARALAGRPSLIQVLEQRGLLSTVEKLGLLSTAEKSGVTISLPEKLGLLKFVEENKLLTLAENVLTDSSTVPKALIAAATLAGGAFLIGTAEVPADVEFTQGVFAGALGLPALVALGAAVVIGGITSGTKRTADIDAEVTTLAFRPTGGAIGAFDERTEKKAISLLTVLEEKKLLSVLEDNRLLSLAQQLASTAGVTRPLTITEQQGVLGKLEGAKLLSAIESTASDKTAAVGPALLAAFLVGAAVVSSLSLQGPLAAVAPLLLGLPAVGLAVYAIVIGILNANLERPR